MKDCCFNEHHHCDEHIVHHPYWGGLRGDIRDQLDLMDLIDKAGHSARWSEIRGDLLSNKDLAKAINEAKTNWCALTGDIESNSALTERIMKLAEDTIKSYGVSKYFKDFIVLALKDKNVIKSLVESWMKDCDTMSYLKSLLITLTEELVNEDDETQANSENCGWFGEKNQTSSDTSTHNCNCNK